jgi:hypothetical protein
MLRTRDDTEQRLMLAAGHPQRHAALEQPRQLRARDPFGPLSPLLARVRLKLASHGASEPQLCHLNDRRFIITIACLAHQPIGTTRKFDGAARASGDDP